MKSKIIVVWFVGSCLVLGVFLNMAFAGVANKNDIKIASYILEGNFLLMTIVCVYDCIKISANEKID